jgi:hypothetical protein
LLEEQISHSMTLAKISQPRAVVAVPEAQEQEAVDFFAAMEELEFNQA